MYRTSWTHAVALLSNQLNQNLVDKSNAIGLVLQDLRFSFSSLWINQLLNASAGLYGYSRHLQSVTKSGYCLVGKISRPPPPRWVGGCRDGWVGWPQISAFWATRPPPPQGGCAFFRSWVCAWL